jgi:DNA sulfur modification protein DndB
MKKLHLPCLRGKIGEWSYFSTVMKIKDIVDKNRIITVAESPELYTRSINDILQRELKTKRISSIKKYLTENDERFFSSLVVAIHKGDPQWSDFDIEQHFKVENAKVPEEQISFIENKVGILTLSGTEEIFALDGQHRLKGIRQSYRDKPELGEEELSLVFVIHNHKLKEKTRRLFTVLNKYAEKPSGAELVILDEDDAAAINTRKLVTDHKIFKLENALSNANSGSLPKNDMTSLTTLVTLYQINKILYNKPRPFYTKRPSDNDLKTLYDKSVEFWDFLFENFPEIIDFIKGKKDIKILKGVFNRNNDTGGSLLLRPIGQVLLARVYKEFESKKKLNMLKSNIRKVDFNLSGPVWEYIYWNNNKMLSKNEKLKKSLLNYILGNFDDKGWLTKELTKMYESVNLEYKGHIKPVMK